MIPIYSISATNSDNMFLNFNLIKIPASKNVDVRNLMIIKKYKFQKGPVLGIYSASYTLPSASFFKVKYSQDFCVKFN